MDAENGTASGVGDLGVARLRTAGLGEEHRGRLALGGEVDTESEAAV